MQDALPLPDGGIDPQIVDRRNRRLSRPPAAARSRQPPPAVFRRGVGRSHRPPCRHGRATSVSWCTASSSTACCAAPPNCGRSARSSRAGRSRLQHRAALAEPRRRHRAARAHAADCAQPRHQVAAHALPGRQPAHAAACAQVRGRAQVRFRQRGRRSRSAALDAALADAGGCRAPRPDRACSMRSRGYSSRRDSPSFRKPAKRDFQYQIPLLVEFARAKRAPE